MSRLNGLSASVGRLLAAAFVLLWGHGHSGQAMAQAGLPQAAAPAPAPAKTSAPPPPSLPSNEPAQPEDPALADLRALLSIALKSDLQGRPQVARPLYDLLANTALNGNAAIPSAINQAVLGRYAEAARAFEPIAQGPRPAEAGYAQLWQLWLAARTGQADANTLRARAATAAAASPLQRALLDLYLGKGNLQQVDAAIAAMAPNNDRLRAELTHEAALFAGGFHQYVLRQPQVAQSIYLYALGLNVPTSSLERPLLVQTALALRASGQLRASPNAGANPDISPGTTPAPNTGPPAR